MKMENIVFIAAPRDLFDYLATCATLLLSVIAVIIAVSTAKRQNRIALFEKRDSCYSYIRTLYNSTEAINKILTHPSFKGSVSECQKIIKIRYDSVCSDSRFEVIEKADYLYFSQKIQYSDKESLSKAKRLFKLNANAIKTINEFIVRDSFLLRAIILEITGDRSDYPLKNETNLMKIFLEKSDFEHVLNTMVRQITMNHKRRLEESEL